MLIECNFFFDSDKNKTEKKAKKHTRTRKFSLFTVKKHVKNSLTLSHNAGQITVTLK